MKKQETFSIRFFDRKSRVTKQQYGPLFVRITVNANRLEISLSKTVSNEIWHEKLQKCKGNSKEAKATNDFLEATIFRLNDIRQRLIIEGKEITADFIKARYKGLPDPDEIQNP
ncbi:MAG TPA: Arm DNA-binding domain-containing protein, partial [Draconibacterium sp.]|nr:Arm DNA-binding domain-containing protein [Draconibacterium sp.]